MRILIFTAGVSCSSCHALKRRLEQFFTNSPECANYIQYVNAFEDDEAVEFYQVKSAPTMICIDKSGAICSRFDGFDPKIDYESAIFSWVRHRDDMDAHLQTYRGFPRFAH